MSDDEKYTGVDAIVDLLASISELVIRYVVTIFLLAVSLGFYQIVTDTDINAFCDKEIGHRTVHTYVPIVPLMCKLFKDEGK